MQCIRTRAKKRSMESHGSGLIFPSLGGANLDPSTPRNRKLAQLARPIFGGSSSCPFPFVPFNSPSLSAVFYPPPPPSFLLVAVATHLSPLFFSNMEMRRSSGDDNVAGEPGSCASQDKVRIHAGSARSNGTRVSRSHEPWNRATIAREMRIELGLNSNDVDVKSAKKVGPVAVNPLQLIREEDREGERILRP